MWKLGIAVVSTLAIAGCATTPPVTVREALPADAEVAIIMFRDCVITGQEDCDGSGNTAGSIFARVLTEKGQLRAVPLSRPIGAKESLTDDAAAIYGKSKGYKYVLNGEVDDYYRVAPMTFRTERAGVSIRVLRTEDGGIVAFFSHRTHSQTNLTTPDALIEDLAAHVRQAISH
jgi:hypothetical protein